MKKGMLIISLFLSGYSFADYKAVLINNNNLYETELPEPIIPITGYLMMLYSVENSATRNANDVTKINEPTWEEKFGNTKDLVINEVSGQNDNINQSGVINWFDSSRKLKIAMRQACWSSDKADTDIEYLDSNDNIVFWTKTRYKQNFKLRFTYGKASDFSDSKEAVSTASYPNVNGFLSFDAKNKTVSYNHENESKTLFQPWTLTNVDVSSIKKIRLSSSNVVTTYYGGTCGAYAYIALFDENI